MIMRAGSHPLRDDLAAAIERAERLGRENAVLRARLAAPRFDAIQWMLVGVIALCGAAITYTIWPML